jgi:trans-2,3-dihydro-3-hydroxyanthranilate isomerase
LPQSREGGFAWQVERGPEICATRLSRRSFLRLAALVSLGSTTAADTSTRRVGEMNTNQVEVVHTRVFAAGPEGGNPCPVIPFADRLTETEMQDFARKFELDTVFILSPRSKAADIRLRYFVPDHEMGVSGHATIAAVTVALLDKTLQSDRARIETSSGLFEAQSLQRPGHILVTLEQKMPIFGPIVTPDLISSALNVGANQIDLTKGPIQSVSVSRAKLLVPLRDSTVLNSLTPNFETLWELCDKFQVSGFYPFARHTDKENADAEARQFPLRAGFPEDAATGVAAAALGAYLVRYDLDNQTGPHEFRIAQGYAMGAPSLIAAVAECANGKITRTAIRGIAGIVGRERVALSNSGPVM